MKRFFASTLFILSLLAACAPSYTPEQTALLERMAHRPVTCEEGEDCDEKWNRALQWVTANSQQRIREVTDKLIATNMVSSNDSSHLRVPEFTVVRYKSEGHEDTIEFSSYCESGFECGRRTLKLRADFVNAVMGLPVGVVQTGPGAYRVRTSAPRAAQ